MDEFFEILTLVQLRKLGTRFPVPVMLFNPDGFYDGLLDFLGSCHRLGTVGSAELNELLVAEDVGGVVHALAEFYGIPLGEDGAGGAARKVLNASEWVAARQKKSPNNE